MRKILICPWFGALPAWWPQYEKHIEGLKAQGYDFLLTTDLEDFKRRCKEVLKVDCPIVPGTGKIHDFRAMLGELYAEEIKGYDFWGHTDFDCVYGNVSKYVTDEFLSELDVHSNHDTYVCGPWTLYRNKPEVNSLFRNYPQWRSKVEGAESNGWVEKEFSRLLEDSGLRYTYTYWQGRYDCDPNLELKDGKLTQNGREIMMYHFRRSKTWPLP